MQHSINDFYEPMDHEFGNIGIELKIFGFKVDGDGIKKHCHLNQLKSVDYIYPENDDFPLVEFSDIYRQHNALLNDIQKIKCSSGLDSKLKTEFIKGKHNEINRELVQKYKDSLTIINQLKDCLSDIPENLPHRPQHYYVIVAPFHSEIEQARKHEIVRFLDDLKSKITQAIPDKIFIGVTVIPVHNFANNY